MTINSDGGEGIDGTDGTGAADFIDDGLPSANGEEAANRDGDDEGDDLIAGEGRDQGGDGDKGAADEEASKVARKDGEIIGLAEIIHGDDHGKGEGQGQHPDEGGGEELSEDGAAKTDRKGSQKLDGAGGVFR